MEQQKTDHIPDHIIDLRVAKRKILRIDLRPTPEQMAHLAGDLGVSAIKKLRLYGDLSPRGKTDWDLQATLGASVVQPCRISLQPVATRIDVPLRRSYAQSLLTENYDPETQMTDDSDIDPLPTHLNLLDVMAEGLALEIPDYPTHPEARFKGQTYTAPGVAPMTDDDAKPFAGLAALKETLENKSD